MHTKCEHGTLYSSKVKGLRTANIDKQTDKPRAFLENSKIRIMGHDRLLLEIRHPACELWGCKHWGRGSKCTVFWGSRIP